MLSPEIGEGPQSQYHKDVVRQHLAWLNGRMPSEVLREQQLEIAPGAPIGVFINSGRSRSVNRTKT